MALVKLRIFTRGVEPLPPICMVCGQQSAEIKDLTAFLRGGRTATFPAPLCAAHARTKTSERVRNAALLIGLVALGLLVASAFIAKALGATNTVRNALVGSGLLVALVAAAVREFIRPQFNIKCYGETGGRIVVDNVSPKFAQALKRFRNQEQKLPSVVSMVPEGEPVPELAEPVEIQPVEVMPSAKLGEPVEIRPSVDASDNPFKNLAGAEEQPEVISDPREAFAGITDPKTQFQERTKQILLSARRKFRAFLGGTLAGFLTLSVGLLIVAPFTFFGGLMVIPVFGILGLIFLFLPAFAMVIRFRYAAWRWGSDISVLPEGKTILGMALACLILGMTVGLALTLAMGLSENPIGSAIVAAFTAGLTVGGARVGWRWDERSRRTRLVLAWVCLVAFLGIAGGVAYHMPTMLGPPANKLDRRAKAPVVEPPAPRNVDPPRDVNPPPPKKVEPPKKVDPPALPKSRVMLKPFNELIGSWSSDCYYSPLDNRAGFGSAKETVAFEWKFKGDDAWITLAFTQNKHFDKGTLRYLPDKELYRLSLETIDKQNLDFEGKLKDKGQYNRDLTLERIDDKKKEAQRFILVMNHEKRFLYSYEVKPTGRASFWPQFRATGKKEGAAFANGEARPECIVSGGLGTIKVMYKGKDYHLCCAGCRDAFMEEPEKYIKEFEARKKGK